eukprot:490293-Amphidinium_carterae.1
MLHRLWLAACFQDASFELAFYIVLAVFPGWLRANCCHQELCSMLMCIVNIDNIVLAEYPGWSLPSGAFINESSCTWSSLSTQDGHCPQVAFITYVVLAVYPGWGLHSS